MRFLKLVAQTLFVLHLHEPIPLFFRVFFPLFFVDLFLKGFSHLPALLLSLHQHNLLFISALQDRTLLLKLQIDTVFSHTSSCHDRGEVSFRLDGRVRWVDNGLLDALGLRLLVLLELLKLSRLVLWLLYMPVVRWLLSLEVLLCERPSHLLRLLLELGHRNGLILIEGVLGLLAP
jgi:hypothetical protein